MRQGKRAENPTAALADAYSLLHFAGSDNHFGALQKKLAGMEFETPIKDEKDFVSRILNGEGQIFQLTNA